jgi:2-oxo-4-hydroxy-4-carboxy-5-ureidoimidazoline decarboxylase
MAAHRPYPDLAALLAASDEAAYDLSPDELLAAVREECRLLRTDELARIFLAADAADRADRAGTPAGPAVPGIPARPEAPEATGAAGLWSGEQVRVVRSMPRTARTAVRAAWVAYEQRFGHGFVLSLEGVDPQDALDHVLATVHRRLALTPEEERVVAAEELRQLARERLTRLIRSASPREHVPEHAEKPPFAPPLGLPV